MASVREAIRNRRVLCVRLTKQDGSGPLHKQHNSTQCRLLPKLSHAIASRGSLSTLLAADSDGAGRSPSAV